MPAVKLWLGNHNVVELSGVKNSVTKVVDTGAVVSVVVKDRAGVLLVGQGWPAAMAHDVDGTYRATLEPGVELIENQKYKVILEATGTGGEIGHWEMEALAAVRDS